MKKYRAVAGECVVQNEHDAVIWKGKPEGNTVLWAQCVPDSDDGLVLFDYYRPEKRYGAFENLVRISPFGSIVFRAELPESSGDAYVSAEIKNGQLFANSWSCYRVQIDIFRGRIVERLFTK